MRRIATVATMMDIIYRGLWMMEVVDIVLFICRGACLNKGCCNHEKLLKIQENELSEIWDKNTHLIRRRSITCAFKQLGYVMWQEQDLQLRGCSGIERLTPQFTSGNNLRRLTIVTRTSILEKYLAHASLPTCKIFALNWKQFTKIDYCYKYKVSKYHKTGIHVSCIDGCNMKGVSKLIKLLSKIPTLCYLEFNSPSHEVFRPPPSDLARPATKAVNLRSLTVYPLKIYNFCQIINVVYMIRSFPNLQDICIELALDRVKSLNPKESTIELYLASLDWKDMCLDRLQTVKMKGVVYSRYVLHFIKLLVASSPSLEVILLFCNKKNTGPKEKLRINP